MSKKSQSGAEFLMIVGVVIFFFTIFFIAINESKSEKLDLKQTNRVKEIALTLQDEINLAFKSTDGYYREFKLPADIIGKDYEISIAEKLVYVKTDDGKDAIAYQTAEVTGQPIKGDNTIRIKGGVIYLNS